MIFPKAIITSDLPMNETTGGCRLMVVNKKRKAGAEFAPAVVLAH